MKDKMNIWQSLGLQGNHHTLPNQSSSYSISKSNKSISFLPLVSCHGIGSRQNFENIVASDSLLSWNDLFWNCRWLASEPLKTSRWHSLVDLSMLFYITQSFSHITHSISILASSFPPLLFIFLKWSFIHSLTPIFAQPFFHSFLICILYTCALSFNRHSFLFSHIASFCCLIVQCSFGVCSC